MIKWHWRYEDKGVFTLYDRNQPLLSASARAKEEITHLTIDTRAADFVEQQESEDGMTLIFEQSGIRLIESLRVTEIGAEVCCTLSRADGGMVDSGDLVPLIAHGKGDETPYLWRALGAKMLLVPYDNDMWMRYETVALRAGRRSSDVTVLMMEDTREGLLIGALDFEDWKNAIACPPTDARILEARCGRGACGEDTHDVHPHGTLTGKSVSSSRFLILYGKDWRHLLEQYGDRLHQERTPREWNQGVPFGFNTFAGMARTLTPEKFRFHADWVGEQLRSLGFENNGKAYINMDGGWQFLIGKENAEKLPAELHAKGLGAGIYDSPFACWSRDLHAPLPLMADHCWDEILLRDEDGNLLPRVDGSLPLDVTHPVWEEHMIRFADQIIAWGYDYLKIDFLSHAGMEGHHYRKDIRTGRQALNYGYRVLERLYDEKRVGRPFFLSLSIAPLFPYGFGNARRFSCDAFGLAEDVEYVLNAQTYSWWTSGRLYQFNDPDHIVLQRSFCMLKDSTEGEARARYTSASIAGSVMLLSEDLDKPGAKERSLRIAGNPAVNAVARSGQAFRPVDAAGGSACSAFTANIQGTPYVALFSWKQGENQVSLSLNRADLPDGVWEDLWTGQRIETVQGKLIWTFSELDAVLLRKVSKD